MENPKENFTNIETFDDSIPSIQDMKDYIDEKVETASEESYEQPLDSTKSPENPLSQKKNTETEINNKLEAESSQDQVCRSDKGNSDKGDCLFGCPKEDSKETNLAEMMSTIEETEKICDMIEEKESQGGRGGFKNTVRIKS
jgi:protein-tyrosine phosphatase